VPGRVAGTIETDPARARPDSILLIRQEHLAMVSAPPAALVLAEAAPFSHPLIRWLGCDTPVALIGIEEADRWGPGQAAILDCARGELRKRDVGEDVPVWESPRAPQGDRPVMTADGTAIRLEASVADAPAAHRAARRGASGIGLVRSEYLHPADGSRPTADFYRRAFADLLTAAEPLGLAIRLLDLAQDKWPPWLTGGLPGEAQLGLHGSQLFDEPAVAEAVAAQVAALADLPRSRRLRLIWPSGRSLDDFRRWRDQARAALGAGFPIGAMVETPMEALALDRWASEADFVGLGCNDLLQHLCGADRDDPRQRRLLDPYRPELFRFLRYAADRAGPALDKVHLCGLLSQVEGVLPMLIGLGFRNFSGEAALIPLLARVVAEISGAGCAALVAGVCAARGSAEVRESLGVAVEGQWGLVRDNPSGAAPGP
jgi:phosphoenolpyruvate-protein kinase (PTS system EI component)